MRLLGVLLLCALVIPGAQVSAQSRNFIIRVPSVNLPAGVEIGRQPKRLVVTFRFGAQGQVEGCRATRSSGISVIDATSCDLITRRFPPGRPGQEMRLDFEWYAVSPDPAQVRVRPGDPLMITSGGYISYTDYPSEANGRSGTVRYEMDVSAGGMPTGCRILESSGVEVLDTTTCALAMERARYLPSIDEAGNRRAATHQSLVRWQGN